MNAFTLNGFELEYYGWIVSFTDIDSTTKTVLVLMNTNFEN